MAETWPEATASPEIWAMLLRHFGADMGRRLEEPGLTQRIFGGQTWSLHTEYSALKNFYQLLHDRVGFFLHR